MLRRRRISFFFFFNDTATTEIYTLSLHDALPIWIRLPREPLPVILKRNARRTPAKPALIFYGHKLRSEEHTSELQSRLHLVCRLLLEKKKKNIRQHVRPATWRAYSRKRHETARHA